MVPNNGSGQTNLSVPDYSLGCVTRHHGRPGVEGGATFDPTHTYRYELWRRWDSTGATVTFVMLNPSKADAIGDDPTIRRCMGLARRWRFGAVTVVNLFGLVSTNPSTLRLAPEPVGALNDRHIRWATKKSDRVVAAWGNWGSLLDRASVVMDMLGPWVALEALGVTASGAPRHPLYVRNDVALVPYRPRA